MKKSYPILLCCLLVGAISVQAQNYPSREEVQDPILKNQVLSEDDAMTAYTFAGLEANLRNKDMATNDLLTAEEIRMYVDRYANDPSVTQELDYDMAYKRIADAVDLAADRLNAIGNAQNVTLLKSDAFYGDKHNISHVIQHRVEIVDQKGAAIMYDVVYTEINGSYRILAVNSDF